MSFKMIREAQALARLGNKAQFAKQVQHIIGVDSITTIEEDMAATDVEVTPAHYNEWLSMIVDIAAEEGVTLTKRQAFNDIAHEILDNDSFIDSLGGDMEKVKSRITNTLWQSLKVSKAHSSVQAHVANAVGKAREDEELHLDPEEDHNPYPPGSLRAALWDEGNVDILGDVPGKSPEDADHTEEVIVTDDKIDSESLEDMVRRIVGHRDEPMQDQAVIDVAHDNHSSEQFDTSKHYDDEQVSKNMFHHAITQPREMMTNALKDVESEGVNAWKMLDMPKNPHPPKSPAHKAWAKGFKNGAKDSLDFFTAPMSPSKHRPKKR
jgi:hypothetical protein